MTGATQLVEGMIKPDGTMELRESIRLPPGQVRVTVEAVTSPERPTEDWWSYLEHARAELEAQGAMFSTGEEINQYIEQLRSDRGSDVASSDQHEHPERYRDDLPC